MGGAAKGLPNARSGGAPLGDGYTNTCKKNRVINNIILLFANSDLELILTLFR